MACFPVPETFARLINPLYKDGLRGHVYGARRAGSPRPTTPIEAFRHFRWTSERKISSLAIFPLLKESNFFDISSIVMRSESSHSTRL